MQYIDTLEDAKKLSDEDEELGRRVYDDVATLLESYDLQSLEQGNCSYGGCDVSIKTVQVKWKN